MITFSLSTRQKSQCIDISGRVEQAVAEQGLTDGVVLVYVPHTTAGITINEGADPSVMEDLLHQLDQLVPAQGRYRHLEGNSPAHIKASLMGSSVLLAVEGGRLVLGRWQAVFFCEFDGPRTRKVLIKTLSL